MRINVRAPNLEDRMTITNLGAYFRYELLPFAEDTGLKMNRSGIVGDDESATHEQSMAGEAIWWSKPGILLPMLITMNDEPAGFAGIARPPHASRAVDYRIENFFIVNKWRRTGLGREALRQIVERYPGRWEVGWLPRNEPAAKFWRAVAATWSANDWPVAQAPGTPSLPGLFFVVEQR